ncbi:MAG: hypothetical protein H6R15_1002 [Proteobacteria bacterium]|nr:hypothetical protein [Pseudomonadota bacterium]
MSKEERHKFLDAIRPQATRMAGQPVRFKVDRLNYVSGWAVLVGGLMAGEGKVMDWSKAGDCDPTLDKMLWVVAKKEPSGWRVKEMYICASEPPYWNLEPNEAFSRPCGLYAELPISGDETAEHQCRAYLAKKRRAKP